MKLEISLVVLASQSVNIDLSQYSFKLVEIFETSNGCRMFLKMFINIIGEYRGLNAWQNWFN